MSRSPAPNPNLPRVELHGYTAAGAARHNYGYGDIDDVVDVTPFVTNLSWWSGIFDPWEGIEVTLALPFGMLREVMPGFPVGGGKRNPVTGFWVVIWNPGRTQAMAWGHVIDIDLGIEAADAVPNGRIQSQPVIITCESFLSFVGRSRMILDNGGFTKDFVAGNDGFVFTYSNWCNYWLTAMKSVGQHKPGVVLSMLWKDMMKMTLPNTLIGPVPYTDGSTRELATVGQEVKVVHDKPTARLYAPQRVSTQLPVEGWAMNSMGGYRPGGSIFDWLYNMFNCDLNMVEIFPSLEPIPGEVAYSQRPTFGDAPAVVEELNPVATAARVYGLKDEAPLDEVEGKVGTPDHVMRTRYPTAASRLGRILGMQPVLVYRMKPWLLSPITQEVSQDAENRNAKLAGRPPLVMGVPDSERLSRDLGERIWQDPVGPIPDLYPHWFRFEADDLLKLRLGWSDRNRTNGIYTRTFMQPQSQVDEYGLWGMPIIAEQEIHRHGFRLRDIEWPMLPNVLPDKGRDLLTRRINALIEYSWAMLGQNELFAQGRFTSACRPWMRAGHWVRLWIDASQTAGWRASLAAYAERVQHTFTVDQRDGHVEARTHVDYSHGWLDDHLEGGEPPIYDPTPFRDATFGNVQFADVRSQLVSPTKTAQGAQDDLITPHFRWATWDPMGLSGSVPEHRQNIVATAVELEKLVAFVGDGANGVHLTPHGGYQGSHDGGGWPARKPGSGHRNGTAADIKTLTVKHGDGTPYSDVELFFFVLVLSGADNLVNTMTPLGQPVEVQLRSQNPIGMNGKTKVYARPKRYMERLAYMSLLQMRNAKPEYRMARATVELGAGFVHYGGTSKMLLIDNDALTPEERKYP